MSVQGMNKKDCIVCGTCPNLATRISQQCNSCCLSFWLTLWRSLHYFLVFALLTLNILCLLQMSINSNLWYIFVEHQVRDIFMDVLAKHYQWLALWSVLHRYLSVSCYIKVIFNSYYFMVLSIGKWKMLDVINQV